MYKIKVKEANGKERILHSEKGQVMHSDVYRDINEIVRLIGQLFLIFKRVERNKQTLVKAVQHTNILVNIKDGSAEHLQKIQELFDYIEMLDVQGCPVESDDPFISNIKKLYDTNKMGSLTGAMAILWAKTNPELLKKCPEWETNDRFPFLYEKFQDKGSGELPLVQGEIEETPYDLEAAIADKFDLDDQELKLVRDIKHIWEDVLDITEENHQKEE